MEECAVRTFLWMRVRQGSERAFVNAWQEAAREISRVPGCVQQDLLAETGDPRTYLIVAEWADRAALDAFGRSEHRDRLTASLRDLRESAERKNYQVLTSIRSDAVPSRKP